MRQLLLAAFVAASSLQIRLPAAAQLDTDLSIFTGEVPASCSITNLEDNYVLPWSMGGLRGSASFTITANTQVSVSASYEEIQVPPNANPSEIFRLYQGNTQLISLSTTPKSQQITFDSENSASLRLSVVLYKGTIYNSVPPGDYTYRATISCLQ